MIFCKFYSYSNSNDYSLYIPHTIGNTLHSKNTIVLNSYVMVVVVVVASSS
jgi:hypothetical protein